MSRTISVVFPLIVLLLLPFRTSASVEIVYLEPESYTDASLRYYDSPEKSVVLKDLSKHLEKLSDQYLDTTQQLKMEILDMDLAGRFEPWHARGYDIRYLRDITWPRMKVRYELLENGQIISSAEETISDMSYLMHVNRYFHSDRLRYEKSMLDGWFRSRFSNP